MRNTMNQKRNKTKQNKKTLPFNGTSNLPVAYVYLHVVKKRELGRGVGYQKYQEDGIWGGSGKVKRALSSWVV